MQDARVLPKLHRRVFLDKVHRSELTIYISFYIEAANRDAYMATKQEIFLQFALACERHGAQLASNRHQVRMLGCCNCRTHTACAGVTCNQRSM
jgi:mechanosensitive ion channel protein 1/2/3